MSSASNPHHGYPQAYRGPFAISFPHWSRKEQIKPKKTVWRFLKKLKLELPYKPVIPFLGIYPKEIKTLCQRDICTPVFMAALFATAKTWKQPDGRIKKVQHKDRNRSMEQNGKPRDESTHLRTPYLRQRRLGQTVEKRQSL